MRAHSGVLKMARKMESTTIKRVQRRVRLKYTHHTIDVGDADPWLLLTVRNGPFAVIAMRRENLPVNQVHLLHVLHSADIRGTG